MVPFSTRSPYFCHVMAFHGTAAQHLAYCITIRRQRLFADWTKSTVILRP
ncbi:hypothetical protein FAEPRAA2165_01026 [Faecalibacterium duncaniae]|uniref:Uncharacterized protein n=1 Tax=Faecalibacterium duncaniae (strain DSM 17677 / JCM 31915 / A2-165) TaxID=411483 RepID=C7H414_FAED2|nr:hypothetical protein FAEPRAA2165_01026 [Faecalibacterium duncaniae]